MQTAITQVSYEHSASNGYTTRAYPKPVGRNFAYWAALRLTGARFANSAATRLLEPQHGSIDRRAEQRGSSLLHRSMLGSKEVSLDRSSLTPKGKRYCSPWTWEQLHYSRLVTFHCNHTLKEKRVRNPLGKRVPGAIPRLEWFWREQKGGNCLCFGPTRGTPFVKLHSYHRPIFIFRRHFVHFNMVMIVCIVFYFVVHRISRSLIPARRVFRLAT
jgi:hypothetical protein